MRGSFQDRKTRCWIHVTTVDPIVPNRSRSTGSNPVCVEYRFELFEGVPVAHMPAVFVTRHSNPIGVGLPVTVGCRDVNQSILRGQVVNLTQSFGGIQDMFDHVEEKNLVELAVLGWVSRE